MPKKTNTPREPKTKVDPALLAEQHAHSLIMGELVQRKEELHPDLVPFVDMSGPRYAWFVKHPLIHTPLINNALLNYQYSEARRRIAEAEAAGDWLAWIGVHEPPYRLAALDEIGDKLSDDDYWEVVGEVFCDVENAWQNKAEVRRLLTANRPSRERLMSDEEREALAALPDVITIWRGYGRSACKLGWSWTTARKTAEWFAERFASLDGVKPKVVSGECDKVDVVAYFTRREESEVVIDPKKVKISG